MSVSVNITFLSFNSFIEEVKTNYSLESMSYDNVNYPARDKRIEKENAYKAKQAAFKESKMKQLVEWVLKNTEKRGEGGFRSASSL